MAGESNRLIFANAEKARDAITASQLKKISKLYDEWADEIGKMAKRYKNKDTDSAVLMERQLKELQRMLKKQSKQVANEVYRDIKQSIYLVSDEVVSDNAKWLAQYGFAEKGVSAAFTSVPDSTVRRVITGQIYQSGWSLSQRIWSGNEKTMQTVYQLVARGMAENKSVYEIAKDLEKYVRPNATKKWNYYIKMKNARTGKWEKKRLYKRDVDYNAQRLARTLIQHGYQQSFIAVTEKNPFVLKYQWSANGSRACKLCLDRDGAYFEKGDLPLDHPNGMCTMIPVIDSNMTSRLSDWLNSPDGTYPDIDEFAAKF